MNKIINLLILCVLAASILGCNESKQPGESTSGKKVEEIVLFTWSDYINPDVVAQFTAETGINVKIETYDSLSQMKGYLSSKHGHYDLVLTDDFNVAELSELKMISKIEKSSIPNFSNFSDAFIGLEFDPNNDFSIPYLFGTVLVAYRSDKVDSPEESWSTLWDPALKGRIAMTEDEQDAFGVGLLANGYSLRSNNPSELEHVAKALVEHARTMDPRYLDLEDIKSQLDSGDLWAALCYSGDALVMADENENIDCYIPTEGAPLWLDSFAVVQDAPNHDNAHRFIDFMARGEVAAENANYLWTATPNKEAGQFLDPEMKLDPRVFLPEDTFAKCEFYALPTADRERISNAGMKAVMDVIHPHVSVQKD